MKAAHRLLFPLMFLALPAAPQQAHSNVATSASTAVPPLIPYAGVVSTIPGTPFASSASVTFLIYKDEENGEPLFAETQSVAVDGTGHYKAQLGATLTNGIPMDLFATGEARWLEVQVAGEARQPRVLLVSVPYALKAADASTLGGLPPSAFALAASPASRSAVVVPDATSNVTTTGGEIGYVPRFSGVSAIIDSPIFVSGPNVGIGTTTPIADLDVDGTARIADLLTATRGETVDGPLEMSAMDLATAATGFNSQIIKLYTSAFNSVTRSVAFPRFGWQAMPAGNNTPAPSATLNLLSSNVSSGPAPTGFWFNLNGTIHFASGQTFPGTGAGTITGVTPGLALTGGGTTGNVTLNLDTTRVPLLASSNTFTGNQVVNGNLTATNTASAGIVNAGNSFNLGGSPFAFGSLGTNSVYLGFAGNSSSTANFNAALGARALAVNTTGASNSAFGPFALAGNTTGQQNTAIGGSSLSDNSTGTDNVAIGSGALYSNSTGDGNIGVGLGAGEPPEGSHLTGDDNTAVGFHAEFGTGTITNATAIGAFSEADVSNTFVLGCVVGRNSCPARVNVGIGTTNPDNLLTVNGAADKPGGGSWGTYSDGRLKTVNGSFRSGLSQVMQLRPIRYRYKPDNALGIRDSDEHIGVVAQDVQRVIPDAVTENGKGYLLVNNDPIIWSMVNAIQEQQREIERQQKLLRAQSALNEQQAKLLRAQNATMRSLAAEVRETRHALRQVKAQAESSSLTMVASK